MKRYLSILLTVLVLISVFSVSSFADSGNMDITTFDMPFYAEYYDTGSSSWVSLESTKTLTTFDSVSCVRYDVPRITEGVANVRYCNIYHINTLKANHEYNLKFGYAFNMPSHGRLNVYLQILNGSGTVIDVQTIFNSPSFSAGGASWQSCDVSFIPDLSNVTSGYSMRLMFEFQQDWNTYPFQCWLSSTIYFNDNDDDSAWYEKIVNWLERVRDSVSNIGSNIVSGLSNLGNNISGWLTTVKDGIVNKLTEVKNGIVDKLTAIKDNIVLAINNIQAWFVSLGDRISDFFTMLKNYLLYFKHPVTLNADGVPVDSNGNPVYVNPFESALDSVEETITEWIDSVNDFIDSIDDSAETVSEPLQLFKTAFTRFGNGAPFFIGIIVFAVVFFVIRKVVGR